MRDQVVLNYVHAAAKALDLPLTADRATRVAEHLSRTVQMARLLEALPLAADEELAQLYVAAPFPTTESN